MDTKRITKIICAVAVSLITVAGLTLAVGCKSADTTPSPDHSAKEDPVSSQSDEAPDISALASENAKGESVFALSVEDFVDLYNGAYRQKFGRNYLTPPGTNNWYCYPEPSLRFGYDAAKYRFSSDTAIWSIPTLSLYASEDDEIYEVRLYFDDHSYQESLFCEFGDMSRCLLAMVCKELSDEEIDTLFDDLCKLSDSNFFGNNLFFGDPQRPPLTTIYRYGDAGFYCFYGSGSIEICMIPMTPAAIEKLGAENTAILDIRN